MVMLICIIALGILGVLVYFLPSIIASNKNHANKFAIFLLNLLLGWTLLGWVASLVWSVVDIDGSAADNVLRNVGGNKYEDLERLQKLKENGIITEEEFETEKKKILK